MNKPSIPIAVVAFSILAAVPVVADSSPEAVAWLDKMVAASEQGTFSVNLEGEVGMSQMGQDVTASMKGSMTRKDRKHVRMNMSVNLGMQGMQMEMQVLSVADGSTLWTEMENPMLGGKQVMKMGLDQMEALREAAGPMGAGPGASDPLSEIRSLQDKFDFTVEDAADNLVILRGKPKPEMLEELRKEYSGPEDVSEIRLSLDPATGFPVEMRIGGEQPVMTMRFTDFERLDETAIPADTFSYSPPEGVQVTDLGALAGKPPSGDE